MKIDISQSILATNEEIAKENEVLLKEKKVFVLNLMSAPGAGKTTLIEETAGALSSKYNICVIEGDVASSLDALRIKEAGVNSIQINTGGACHLDAKMIKEALSHIDLDKLDLLIIENVGNLVCPAEFYLGETKRAMLSSVSEGDDKPLKYPLMFMETSVLILNKIDLLGLTNFNLEKFTNSIYKLNPHLEFFKVSCRTKEGLKGWFLWLEKEISRIKQGENQ